jgi:AraC-like DNA-binding protein
MLASRVAPSDDTAMQLTTLLAGPARSGMVRFPTANAWIRAGALCDINLPPLLADAGLCIDHLGQHLIRRDGIMALMLHCVEKASPRYHFPLLVADCYSFENMPLLETFMASSPTLRASLEAIEWASRMMTGLSFRVVQEQTEMVLHIVVPGLQHPYPKAANHFVEFVVACLCKHSKRALGGRSIAKSVAFAHDLGPASAHCEAYFGAPIVASQPEHRVVLDQSVLDIALPGGHVVLHLQLREALARHLQPTHQGSLASQIELLFAQQPLLTGQGITQVAQALKMHPRTMQRRLKEDHEQFAQIVNRSRKAFALKHLQDPSISIQAVSDALAFNDRNSFTRAFKSWTGETPSVWRKNLTNAPGINPLR